MGKHIEEETKVGGGFSVHSEVMAAQDIVSFGYGSQSRETMEVEEYSAKSECYGAFERRRETSGMEAFKGAMNKLMDGMEETSIRISIRTLEQEEDEVMRKRGMLVNQNRSTTGGMLMNEMTNRVRWCE